MGSGVGLGPMTAREAPAAEEHARSRSIIEAAIRAPNGENCQPWRFALTVTGFDVWFIPGRAASLFDVSDLGSRMALGALLETAQLAGRPVGVGVRWELDPDPTAPLLWARVSLDSCEAQAEPLAAAIALRQTNRLPYERTPLTAGEQASLLAEVGPAARVCLATDRVRIERIAQLTAVADKIRIENQQAHAGLHRWLRWTAAEVEATRDGLDVGGLCVKGKELWVLRFLRPWWRMRLAASLGVARIMASYTHRNVESSGAILCVSVRELSPVTAVAAGQVLQRAWLRVTQLGLSAAPLGAPTLFPLRLEHSGRDAFGPRHAEMLAPLPAALRGVFGLDEGERALLMLRVGRAAPMPVWSLRRTVDDLVAQ